MAVSTPRLPGIRFETVRPSVGSALPRMDVAGFAGFAAAGPVDVPVAIEDGVRFAEVFGDDLPLAWDAERGVVAHAHLPLAVREFFRNGGRRCWVVRLAQAPEAARFRLPGLLRARDGVVVGGAWARAASPGSWADPLRVHASLLRIGLPPGAVTVDTADPESPGLRLRHPDSRALLRLELDDGTLGFFPPPPPAGAPAADSTPAERRAGEVRAAGHSSWFRPALPGAVHPQPGARLHLLDGEDVRELTLLGWDDDGAARFSVPTDEVGDVYPGAWLRLDVAVPAASELRPEVFLVLDEVERTEEETALVARQGWRWLVQDTAWAAAAALPFRAALVSAELWARRGRQSTARIADVALAPGHERWFGHFPDDAVLHGPVDELAQHPAPDLWMELSRPRFPLAAPPSMAAQHEVLLPLGLEALPREDHEQPALTSGRTPLERDGLADLSTASFLDPDLGSMSTGSILDAAFRIQHGDHDRRALTGLHALLPVGEASMLAVPDAVHRGWVLRTGQDRAAPLPPRPPSIQAITGPDEGGVVRVDWTARQRATGYVLEHGPDPRFRDRDGTLGTAETFARVDLPDPCRDRIYFRVRADSVAGPTAWSSTRRLDLPAHAFDLCGRVALDAPRLRRIRETRDRIVIAWRGDGPTFRLERSMEPTFAVPEHVYEGPLRRIELGKPDATTFFRIAATDGGETSPWSRTRSFVPPLPVQWEVLPPGEAAEAAAGVDPADRVLDVHTAMLRLCAARGDILAVLALPSDYLEEEAVGHAAALAARLGPGSAESGDAGGRVLSFGALYHPWTVVSGTGTRLRSVPPDGAMCGVLAARTLEAGAWAAPANRVVAGALALLPRLGGDARARFLGRHVNPLAPFPEGFMVWSEETLSAESELSGIGVRRLLILLRRLALREGTRFVFQPNDESFRRLVRRQFDGLLGDLFARGAFAGAHADEGYRVIADASVNPPTSVDQGRLVVELRVAPSRPLHFLTVRLTQSGAGLSVVDV